MGGKDTSIGLTLEGAKYSDGILRITYEDYLSRMCTTSAGHMSTLSKGAKVIIRGTDNVVQRFPGRAGMVGKIVDVPQHPNTWFRIKFKDSTVVTLRPSALTLLSTFHKIKTGRAKAKKKSLKNAKGGGSGSGALKASKTLIAHLDPKKWIGHKVVLVGAKEPGGVATVLGCGNGWIQLSDDSGNDISRRAYELAIPQGVAIDDDGNPKVSASSSTKKKIKSNGKASSRDGERLPSVSSASSGGSDAFSGGLGDMVLITQGTGEGKKGKVVSAGNGYFCIEISGAGFAGTTLQKRKWELEALSGGSSRLTAPRSGSGGNRPRSGSSSSKRSNSSSSSTNKYMNERVLVNVSGCTSRITGTVVKSGHGFYTVQLDRNSAKKVANVDGRLMKRKEEIRIIDEEGNIIDGGEPFKIAPSKPKTSSASAKKAAKEREKRKQEGKREQKEKEKRKPKPRRRSRTPSPSPSPVRGAPKSKLEATVYQCRERVLGWIGRYNEKLREYVKHRPNLQFWAERINDTWSRGDFVLPAPTPASSSKMEVEGEGDEKEKGAAAASSSSAADADGEYRAPIPDERAFTSASLKGEAPDEEDEFTPALWAAPFCRVCRLEKENAEDACWNAACWASPVYRPGAAPLDAMAIPKKVSDRTYAIAQSPRKRGFISVKSPRAGTADVGIDGDFAPRTILRHSKFTAGRKAEEQNVATNPLVSHGLRAPVYWLGRKNRPPVPPRDSSNCGYFGVGWLSDPDSDSDYDPDDFDPTQGPPTRDSFLEYRWRSWAAAVPDTSSHEKGGANNAPAVHPQLSSATALMKMAYGMVEEADVKAVKRSFSRIKAQSGNGPSRKRVTSPASSVGSSGGGKKRGRTSPAAGASASKRKKAAVVRVPPAPSPSPPLPPSMERLNHLKLPDTAAENAVGIVGAGEQPAFGWTPPVAVTNNAG